MTEPTTPGQVAYAAYVAALRPSVVRYLTALYANLGPDEHAAWDAAAQAVLDACAMLCPICGAELARCNATDIPHH